MYSEILLLGNLLTITQGGGETLETMTFADKIVVMMWQVMMAIKLTGIKTKGIKMFITWAQVKGKKRKI